MPAAQAAAALLINPAYALCFRVPTILLPEKSALDILKAPPVPDEGGATLSTVKDLQAHPDAFCNPVWSRVVSVCVHFCGADCCTSKGEAIDGVQPAFPGKAR